ncbi:MAG: serine/threonine protein kinase [Anaerolineae bacterium]|jgi:serine/threonine protein kinase|nr:serine/threonine protein kinase [Anaerolineae bacterium]
MSQSSFIGKTIGKYEVVDLIGQGGMATVYLGYQRDIDRQVAIKILPPHPGMNASFVERFQQEARTVARLQHPHILQLYDYGRESDVLYFVTPYVKSGSLETWIKSRSMSPKQIGKLVREIGSALDYAHRQGVVHRDLKPGNILIDSEGHTLLADFGIAKMMSSEVNLTGTGIVGTPTYMAPEQVQGLTDPRSDIYALGIICFELLTGRAPYQGETALQTMMKHMQSDIPSILTIAPELPSALEPVMLRVMSKEPDDRYQTATEFADEFNRTIQGLSTGEYRQLTFSSTPRSAAPTQAPIPTEQQAQTPVSSTPQPTVIIQQSTNNTPVLLGGFALLALLIIVGIIAIVNAANNAGFPPGPPPNSTIIVSPPVTFTTPDAIPTFGSLSFGTINSPGDTLSLRLNQIEPPPSGKVYVAWLLNTRDETVLNIGRVTVDAVGDGALSYTVSDGTILPTLYNAVWISLEDNADVTNPQGERRYRGQVPPAVMDLITALFVEASEGERSLIDGLDREASVAQQHAGLASASTDLRSLRIHAEHTINIIAGTQVDYNGDGRAENPGSGIGIYRQLDQIAEALNQIVAAPEVTPLTVSNAEKVRICLLNVRQRADQVIILEQEMLAAPDFESTASQRTESTEVIGQLIDGFDFNENGQVEAFEGECGLAQFPQFGILLGGIEIYLSDERVEN